MCIVAFAWQVLDDTPLCLISNRDEFYQRPTASLQQWADSPIIAGQDLQSGGTWMGITASGRWAIVTNFRDGQDKKTYPTSRGELIQQYLESTQTPIRFAQDLEKKQCDYAGFNLFVGDRQQAVYMSNRGEAPQVLAKGVYVTSNGLMTEHWEKTRHLRKRFTQELLPMLQSQQPKYDIDAAAWDILEDERKIITELLLIRAFSRKWNICYRLPLYKVQCTVRVAPIYSVWELHSGTGRKSSSKAYNKDRLLKLD